MASGYSGRLRAADGIDDGAWAQFTAATLPSDGQGLFELRPKGAAGIGRGFYCFVTGKRVVMLHAFIKKSQHTPQHDLQVARKRMKEVYS